MKFNIIKITLIITAIFALFLACDKDAEVISNFDFVLTETHAETTTVKYPEQTTFNIVPERVVTSTFYEFKYEILNGEGAYLDDEGNQIPKETFTRLSSRNPIFSYSSDKIGEEKARVTIRDNGGITKTVDVLYTIEHNPYSLEFSTPFNETKVKESKPVTLSLFNTGVDKTVTYERAFFILQGAGNLTVADEEQQIELEDFMPIEEGTYNYDISFDEFGESKVMVATKDSNNQIKNDTLTFQVDQIDVDFTATAERNNAFVGQEFNIIFGISEDQGAGGTYQLRYAVDNGEATMNSSDEPLSPGVLYDVETGGFAWNGIANTPGQMGITFILKNENGVELTQQVSIAVINASIGFDAVPLAAEIFVGESVGFNAIITEEPIASPPYSLRFVSSSAGTLTYNGIDYNPGQDIFVDDSNFAFEYNPISVAEHTITFLVENGLGVNASDVESVMVKVQELSFDAIAVASETNLGIPVVINAAVMEQPNHSPPYLVKFESTGTATISYENNIYSAGQLIQIDDPQFQLEYIPSTLGNHAITLTLNNNIQIQRQDVININVLQSLLSLDVVPTGNEVFLSQWLSFNASISDNPQTNPPYTLSFASTGTGDLRYDGNSYGPGEEIVINDAQFVFEYMGNSLGNHQITFTAENELDAEGSDVVDIDVLDGTLSLDAVPTGNEVFLSQWLSFNASISDNPQTNPPYTLSFASTGTGDLRYDGNSYGPGEEIVINDAQFVFEYMGNSLGNHQITFTAENELDVEGSDVVGIDVLDATLSFDAVPANANAPIGVPVNFNATISENPLTNPPYTLSFASTGTGTVRYNNANYSSGQDIVINAKQFGFQYTGTTAGNHSITFTATNNLNAEGVDVEAIQIEQSDFNVSSTPSTNPITEGLSYDINHNVSPIAGQQTFQMSYSVNSGSVTMRDQSNGLIQENVLIDVPNGNFDWSVMANSEQDVDITFTIVNNNNVQKQTNVQMDVTSSDFDFTLSYQNNVETGEGVADIQIDLSGDNLFDYELSYSINPNDASVIKENGLVVQQNVPIDVGITDLNFEFVDFTQYSIDISITSSVLPNNPVTKQAIINVVHTPFIFTVSNPNNVDKDNPMDLILALDGSNNLDYTISRSVLDGEGTFNFNNNSVLAQGDNNFRYTPSTINQGEQELRFTATDNFGYSVTIDKVFVVNGPIITSVSTNYLKTGCFDINNTKERCDIILVLVPTMLVQDDIQELRIRYNNTIEDGVAFAQFFTPNQFIVNVGTIDIENNNNTDDTNVDVQNGDDFEVQIRDSNGMWSDWIATTARNSYGLTFH